MSNEPSFHESEPSDDEHDSHPTEAATRKRSSRACDQCRKTKSKCERFEGENEQCKSCALAGVGKSRVFLLRKRYVVDVHFSLLSLSLHLPWAELQTWPAKRLHPRDRTTMASSRIHELAKDILTRVDSGPFGPTGRLNHSVAVTKEDFFASILNSTDSQTARDPSRPRRQSRVSREIVSSNNSALVSPTLEWQDRLSSRYATTGSTLANGYGSDLSRISRSSSDLSSRVAGPSLSQRRRLEGDASSKPDWDLYLRMGILSMFTDSDDDRESEDSSTMFGQLSLDENKEVRHHGKASGLSLLYQNDRTDDRKLGGIWNMPMARVWPPAANQFIPEENVDVNMPPLDVQRHLLELYFVYVHPVFPAVHKSMFLMEFDSTYSENGAQGKAPRPDRLHISNLLLLSMFAIAARYSDESSPSPAGTIWEAGLTYMVQARELLNRVYHYSRPSTCQALLLLGLRETALGSTEHGWLYVGMAIRMAYDLGLHRDADKWQVSGGNLFSPMELQARKQIWWACTRADKYTSVWMGRPPVISETNYDAPLPEVDSDEPWQPHPIDTAAVDYAPVPGHIMECFRASSTLSIIAGMILEQIYSIRPTTHSAKRAALADLEGRLDRWYAELPECLAYDTASKRYVPPPHILQLHMTYWNIVMLLHRAFIPKWKPERYEDFIYRELDRISTRESDAGALKSFDICQSAAGRITAIVVAYQQTFGLRRAAIILTQHMFAAGLMHVITLTFRPSNVQASVSLSQTLSALKEMEVIWPSAHRSWDLLHGAKIQVDSGLLSYFANPSERSNKRPADEAFGKEKSSNILQREAFEELERSNPATPAVPGQGAGNRILAHMLGIDIPGIEPSTSYLPGYEWWPRTGQRPPQGQGQGQGQGQQQQQQQQQQPSPGQSSQQVTTTPSQALSTPSPHSSSHSSPPAALPIPFTFDQTQQGLWMGGMMNNAPQGFGLNYVNASASSSQPPSS
ncbi:hypothetical protein EW146_g2572 [Bondarzewia mesenterica]|uniref:Xylanolytic transcriptional activator regulatory domain-containing protein n=1 Tax=Bondarzewia mesenterica TaxID=1095465 RepID=A0A4S4M238_9AGAM|nr:hypothetical protein EW146_g2572 [Bondarzewia mesenterica]